MLHAMRSRLLVVITIALLAWVLPIAQAMPIDADGPSGFSDNADFDDLIVSLTSPTAAVTAVLLVVAAASFIAMDAVILPRPTPVRDVGRPFIESRAPPLA
jgi:hypothetical protein